MFLTISIACCTMQEKKSVCLMYQNVFVSALTVNFPSETGNAPCVNMIGATIGAGVGPLQGLHGLIIDALRSVLLVTPAGDIVNASSTENSDLFWAIRGAGANFGIITAATYEVHEATNGGQLINADFVFNPASNVSLWQLLKSWDSDNVFPKEMGLTVIAGFNHATGQVSSIHISLEAIP